MSLKNGLNKIKDFLKNRYKDNLAAVLIFGSVNTGHYLEGVSDIDTIIFLKKGESINVKQEINFLYDNLKNFNFSTQYLYSLDDIKKKNSWSTYITIVADDGSKILYTTPEFEKTKKWLLNHCPSKEEIKKYVLEKDNFELEGYFKGAKGFILTKALFSHLRRKLQIINYYETGEIIFDYKKCLRRINLDEDKKRELKSLYKLYEERQSLSSKQIKYYYLLANEFTDKIVR